MKIKNTLLIYNLIIYILIIILSILILYILINIPSLETDLSI